MSYERDFPTILYMGLRPSSSIWILRDRGLTQLYGDYNGPLEGSLLNNQDSMESKKQRVSLAL